MSPLVVMALEVESCGLFEAAGIDVLFTGVGKINATHALTRRLTEIRSTGRALPHVVNFGTAGSRTLKTGTLVACGSFFQRDMNATALGFELGTTPFDRSPGLIRFPAMEGLGNHSCGSGDSFESGAQSVPYDVMEMEAYALAKVCLLENARFTCIKYITDGADHTAAVDWQSSLPHAAAAFLAAYQELQSRIGIA